MRETERGEHANRTYARWKVSACVFLALFGEAGTAFSQQPTGPIKPLPPPPPGQTSTMRGDLRRPNDLRHRDTLGRPCLDISGSARAQTAMPNIYEHVVIAKNSCLQRIRLKVCYTKSDRCFLVEVPPNDVKETILGIFPSMKYFQYDFQEQH